MRCERSITLKNGRICTLHSGDERDGAALLDIYIRTHSQTDFLLSYPDETRLTAEQVAVLMRMELDN